MIAAAAENNALGIDNDLPWHLPNDFQRFKKLTTGHHVIMGRKTWDSLPGKLPNRTHIVISRNAEFLAEGAKVVKDLASALDLAKDDANTFIIGGGEIYKLAMDYASHIELTRVHREVSAHVFFPDINLSQWRLTKRYFNPSDEKHQYACSFETYERNR